MVRYGFLVTLYELIVSLLIAIINHNTLDNIYGQKSHEIQAKITILAYFEDSQPSITKTTRHIAIFNRFQIIFKSFIRAIFHINLSNQDEKNGVSYIRIGCQIKKMIFSSNLPMTAVSKGVKGQIYGNQKLKKSIGNFLKVILSHFKQKIAPQNILFGYYYHLRQSAQPTPQT